MKQIVDVNHIFRLYGDFYRKKYCSTIALNQIRALKDIQKCRTSELGAHKEICDSCGHIRISYNSCRNRHCPKCQSLPAEKWIQERSNEIVSTHYFHVVFTVPIELNPLILRNQNICYKILYKASWETLSQLSENKKYLKAKLGAIGILHTWGQALTYHPHIHFLITGGGLSEDRERWISSKKNFLFPVKVMSQLFKKIFMKYLIENYLNGKIVEKDSRKNFIQLIREIKYKKWVVFCKPPIRDSKKVIEYFGRYTHRVAISNSRILKLENERVFFKWKDYRDGNKKKIMSLEVFEFIRRFLLHILPKKFVKIRYYGLYANRNRKSTINFIHSLFGDEIKEKTKMPSNWKELILLLKGIDITVCPVCSKGRMNICKILLPIKNNSPPKINFVFLKNLRSFVN